ncbi:putative membrane protein YvbJ [Anoxybacillus mongoliensis]|uniref:Putative membrane protein YvbJ n=1 Tax=Anoxybacillus mongoliensis TaxID=452565 RepID=A0A7W8JGM2_9BACL|nr:PEGA domain-containing protein [Anoxybacillus mongoliensis]MBB5355344.1 putative membrane protein YvbJ [Anoxybacillus mongoliensis]
MDEQGGLQKEAMTRSERRKRKQRFVFVCLLFVVSACVVGAWGVAKQKTSEQKVIEQFIIALRQEDVHTLKQFIDAPLEEKASLLPLFAYLRKHPEGYDQIRKELERQKDDRVYIKGLTSTPPIFLMKLSQGTYKFEPALYHVYVRTNEQGARIFVNNTYVGKTNTSLMKVGEYVPGLYEVKMVTDEREQTKRMSLFGGERTRIVHFDSN